MLRAGGVSAVAEQKVICVEALSIGFTDFVDRGKVLDRHDPRVVAHPQFFRELGPPLELKEVNDVRIRTTQEIRRRR